MATRKDLLKAQSFTSRRMIASFINRDPDSHTPPLRRVGMATFVSILLGIVLVAGYTLLGLLKPGSNPNWKTTGVVISDTESGALFVYSEEGDMLIPMADVASARLKAAGENASDTPKTANVKTETLSGMEQAPMEGIPGAPRQLPAPKNMTARPLKLCSTAPGLGDERFVTLDFNAAKAATPNFAFVAQHSDRSEYLIFGGKKHRLWTDPTNSGLAMVSDLPRIPVGNAWIAAMPEGLPIQPLEIEGLGDDNGRWLPGMARGDVGRAPSDTDPSQDQYFVQTAEGIVRISYLDADAIIQKYFQGNSDAIRTLKAQDWKSIDRFNLPDGRTADVPWERPTGAPQESNVESKSICATWSDDNPDAPVISYGDETPKLPDTFRVPVGNAFDYVEMPTLTGALLRNSASTAEDSVTFLITERHKYPIASRSDRAALGYKDIAPVPVPGGLLSQIPDGLPETTSLSLENVHSLSEQQDAEGD